MEEIKLYSHNEEAYEAMINSLENSNFSFIERATGTGKSYILIKYLAMQQKGKRVLFVTTHEPMFNQLVNRDMPSLGVSKKMFKKMDLVIYPNLPKKEAQWYYDNYDCIIFDEATAMLDPSGRKEVMKTIKRLNKEENITTLHITHFMEEAVDADRVIVMEKGKKLLEGTPKEVFSKIDTLKNIGLDVPCMTELSNLLKSEGLDIRDDILTVDEMVMELCQL